MLPWHQVLGVAGVRAKWGQEKWRGRTWARGGRVDTRGVLVDGGRLRLSATTVPRHRVENQQKMF